MATKASEWKGARPTGDQEVTLPSGNTCLVRQLAPDAFLSSGVIPDGLSAIVTKAIKSKKGLPPGLEEKMSKDPKQLRQALLTIDQAVCYVVIEPNLQMPPKCKIAMMGEPCETYVDSPQHTEKDHPHHHDFVEGDREKDVLYADQVSLEDKMYIFQYAVGGINSVKQFRGELSGSVGAVPERKAVARKAKRSGKRR